MGVLIDSSVLIAGERGDERAERLVDAESEVGLSIVTVAEYWKGVERTESATRRRHRTRFFDRLAASLEIVEVDMAVAFATASIWAEMDRAGSRIPSFDLLIAATAIARGWLLATFDLRHFGRVPTLRLLYPDS